MSNSPQFLHFSKEQLLPKEERLEVGIKPAKLFIGVPKEESFGEQRICLAPDAIAVITAGGHRVVVESGAGDGASFNDHDYSEAGAEICYDKKEVWSADVILKVHPPSLDEIDLLKQKQTIISAIQLKIQNEAYFRKLMKHQVTALAYEYMEDDDGIAPVVRSMSEIAGNTSVLIAAELMSNQHGGKGLMLGGITGVNPTNVVVLGAGAAGEFACRAAIGLGASVMVFDKSISKLRRLQADLHTRIATSVLQPKVLEKALRRADAVIGAIRTTHGRTPCIVSEEQVQKMKNGAVLVDISIDQGGCFETSEITTHDNPTFEKHGVIHYCVPNIASRVARSASFALSNVFLPVLTELSDKGGIENMIRSHRGFRAGLYMYHGHVTNRGISDWFGLPYQDINLIMTAF
jgi:alanine dehydrogenase